MPFKVSALMKVDVQAALAAQGYTSARAAKLDQLDAAITTRAAPGAAMALAAPFDARLDVAVSSRASPVDVDTKLEGRGVTSAQMAKLDQLDAAITTRAAPGAAMALAAPFDARLDVAVSSRASPVDVDTKLGDRGVTSARMAKLDIVGDRVTNSGSVGAGENTAGLSVVLVTAAAGQARSVIEVRYSCGGAAIFYAEGSDDGTTWYEGDSFSEEAAVTNRLVGYLNTHRYFRFRSPTTGISLSFELRSVL